MARGRKERELRRTRITVIGEGLTERWYFEHLRSVMGYRYDCKPRFFSRQSYDEMGKLIEWVLQNGGVAVCVCDADVTRTNPAEKQRLKEMKDKYSSDNRVFICDSMPSIEFWFCYIIWIQVDISKVLTKSQMRFAVFTHVSKKRFILGKTSMDRGVVRRRQIARCLR